LTEARRKIHISLPDLFAENCDLFHPDFTAFGCSDGWALVITEMLSQWRKQELPRITVVKEKLGFLRVYAEDQTSHKAKALARQFETRSAAICEVCGAAGRLRKFQGHVATRCDACGTNA
jgi:hypothetical protein